LDGVLVVIRASDLAVRTLGECRIDSPIAALLDERSEARQHDEETDRVLFDHTARTAAARAAHVADLPSFELGGPRRRIYFDPASTRVAIVTCGGLCPGLNDVIRGLVTELTLHYGVRDIVGFRNGFQGFIPSYGHEVMRLTTENTRDINELGGTILGISRGDQDPEAIVDCLVSMDINVLFVIGGDGSIRGALKIADTASARGAEIAVIGIPKTIDNDIPYLDHSFGFQTAVSKATESIRAAYVEARAVPNGVGVVKLMGRHSGFIACYSALAKSDADYVLIPEIPFQLDGPNGLLEHLQRRVERNGHAVIVVAEGAGQDLMLRRDRGTDASGNPKLGDVGLLLREEISRHFGSAGLALNLRYFDPSYSIRSVPANPFDSVYCIRLAHAAVHAAMAGRTAIVVGARTGRFVHIPIALLTSKRSQVDPNGDLWLSVLETTGQPVRFRAVQGDVMRSAAWR
jgi:6-phosphofructokinase 1